MDGPSVLRLRDGGHFGTDKNRKSLNKRKFQMSIEQRIRTEFVEALRQRNTHKRLLLSVVLGEMDTARLHHAVDDDKVCAIIRKLIESNKETISSCKNAQMAETLQKEIDILVEYLPKTLTTDEIEAFFREESILEQIVNAPSDGAGTGIAMKALKAAQKSVLGAEVKEVVIKIRQMTNG